MDRIELLQPDDFHVHFRQGAAAAFYAKDALEAGFARVLVMPNTLPPVTDAAGLRAYRQLLSESARGLEPLMTFKIKPSLARDEVAALAQAGAVAGKLYPEGATTNSEDGVRRLEDADGVFALMEELDLVLCLHGEEPSAFSMDREAAFLTGFRALRRRFPRLRIVLEHVSTAEGAQAVLEAGPRTAATITAHHLCYTFDDLAGGSLKPHLFCKPLLKRPEDRRALRQAAFSGNPAFFFGSDSAPHARENKESALCSAGCYTMPVSLPLLAELFEAEGRLDRLEPFLAHYGADFYELPRNTGKIVLERRPWVVPESYHGVVPPNAGQTLVWQRTH